LPSLSDCLPTYSNILILRHHVEVFQSRLHVKSALPDELLVVVLGRSEENRVVIIDQVIDLQIAHFEHD
jgi:hypothetical protein